MSAINKAEGINNELSAGQSLDQLVRNVGQEITGACMIPMMLPKKAVVRIIAQAKKWFYKHYEDSLQENYYLIPVTVFQTDEFKRTRSIKLHSAKEDGQGLVYQVYGLMQSGDSMLGLTGVSDADFSLEKWALMGVYSNTAIEGDQLMYYVVNSKYYDMARQIFINMITYNYNRLSRELKILGETPTKPVMLNVSETISDANLFEDEIFMRYVVAKVKIQLGTQIMMFGYNLPGNVTINADMVRDAGQEELDNIIEEIKDDEGVDYFFTS